MLASPVLAIAQFSTFSIGNISYDATQDQSGPGWTWTAETNTLRFPEVEDEDYSYAVYIDGDIAFNTGDPAAVAIIEASKRSVFISGNISSQGRLHAIMHGDYFVVGGNLGGSLETSCECVNVGGNIAGDLSVIGYIYAGFLNVEGNVGGDLTVSIRTDNMFVITINRTVGGAKTITSDNVVVKVNGSFIAGAPSPVIANVTIPLDSLELGTPASGNGWSFGSRTLSVRGTSINYTLTGKAPVGISVSIGGRVNSLTLDGVTIDCTDGIDDYQAFRFSTINPPVYIKNDNTIIGGINSNASGALVFDAAGGATLTVKGSFIHNHHTVPGIQVSYGGLVLQGSGIFNFLGSDYIEDRGYSHGIIVRDLRLQGSVTVNASAGNYIGDASNRVGPGGVSCSTGDLTIADHAKLNATGGDVLGAGGKGGLGVAVLSKVTVTSDAPNALVATGGIGAAVEPFHGSGIVAMHSLLIAGTGEIKALGDYAIASLHDITLSGCKITATADGPGYALYAAGHNNPVYTGENFDISAFAGGTVNITSGAVTARNTGTPANIYYKTLNQTGGSLNSADDNSGGGDNPGGGDGAGSGGGGAPSLLWLGAAVTFFGARATRLRRKA